MGEDGREQTWGIRIHCDFLMFLEAQAPFKVRIWFPVERLTLENQGDFCPQHLRPGCTASWSLYVSKQRQAG